MDNFIIAQYSAQLVGMAAYMRAFLGQAVEDEPEVVSLRVACTHQASGLSVIEWELIGVHGHAIGGGTA